MSDVTNLRRASRAAGLSASASGALTVIKLALGVVTGSVAILSEAVHSATDLVAALIAFWAIRAAAKPPDRQHPYGHERAENLAALLEGALVVAVGVLVMVESGRRLAIGGEVRHLGLAIAVMSGSALVSLSVGIHLRRVARSTESAALAGDALNLQTDAAMAAAVVVSLIAVAATGSEILDPAIAILVGLVICVAGGRLCWSSAQVLADSNLPEEEIREVEAVLRRLEAEGFGFHKVRGRRAGAKRHIDLHMVVPPETTVHEGHILSGRVKRELIDVVPNAEVLIHLEDHGPDFSYRNRPS